jgi:hypothetical protein
MKMDIKKLFFTKVNISPGGAKLLRNATAALLGLYSYAFYGQVQKLDSRFDILLKNKENIAQGKGYLQIQGKLIFLNW